MVTGRPGFVRHVWFEILLVGLVLFAILAAILHTSGNAGLLPPVIVVGAFLVPVSFAAYIYQRVAAWEIPVRTLVVVFLLGGGLGVIVSAVLEYETLRSLGAAQLLGVGVIEESTKLIIPGVIYLRGRYLTEADGLVFGVTTGMGFAAIETMGYGFSAYIDSEGSVEAVELTLVIRGLLSPVGHAAWTGLVCATLWRERERIGRNALTRSVVVAFTSAVLLHTLWDVLGSITTRTTAEWIGVDLLGMGTVGLVSLALLWRRLHEAERKKRH